MMGMDSKWAMSVMALGPIVLAIVSVLLFTPTREELFEACLRMAERAGLREEAALVCLDNATRRR
jgi:pantoate kinase